MTLAGVLGYPVGHSRSPIMMSAAFRELGLDWRYVKLPLAPSLFAETVRALPASGYVGANVTIPHKLAARDLADELSPAAAAIGAANTLSFADGRIRADNTDAAGLIAALEEPVAGRRALVLGAGGAGRAAVWALREAGAEVAIWNRTPERAAALAAEFGVEHAELPGPTDLLVNATSVGLVSDTDEQEALAALRLTRVAPPATMVDLVYGDAPTPLWRWASRGDGRVVGGLEVLVRQGALSLELWSGREAPVEAMRHALSPAGA
jgi:shikimate dehydrogenase